MESYDKSSGYRFKDKSSIDINMESYDQSAPGKVKNKICNINMSSTSKKKLAATEYKEAKSKWTKAKAKYELIKLIEENKVQTKQRKNSSMVEVKLDGEKYFLRF